MKDLLVCLKGVHQSQSLYLLRILGESFLDSCHQSVVRMAERVIRKKLEMYTAAQKGVIGPAKFLNINTSFVDFCLYL